MIPHLNVYQATVKYEVRETEDDRNLFDIVLESPVVDGEIRVYSDCQDDLVPYKKGDSVSLAYTPDGAQTYRILNMPDSEIDMDFQIGARKSLFMSMWASLPDSLDPEARQKIATTLFLDYRKRGPIEKSEVGL